MNTFFAPAERTDERLFRAHVDLVSGSPLMGGLMRRGKENAPARGARGVFNGSFGRAVRAGQSPILGGGDFCSFVIFSIWSGVSGFPKATYCRMGSAGCSMGTHSPFLSRSR